MSAVRIPPHDESAFRFIPQDGGLRVQWSDNPLDFIWQSPKQAADLAMKLHRGCVEMAQQISSQLQQNTETMQDGREG